MTKQGTYWLRALSAIMKAPEECTFFTEAFDHFLRVLKDLIPLLEPPSTCKDLWLMWTLPATSTSNCIIPSGSSGTTGSSSTAGTLGTGPSGTAQLLGTMELPGTAGSSRITGSSAHIYPKFNKKTPAFSSMMSNSSLDTSISLKHLLPEDSLSTAAK